VSSPASTKQAAPAEEASAKSPGRPRDPEADRAILEATTEILCEEGYEGVSIEGVAARAGVGKTTIYRRWTSKAELVVAAIQRYKSPTDPSPPARDESTRDALVRTLSGFTQSMNRTESGRMLAGLVAEMSRNPELAQAVRVGLLEHRRSIVYAILDRGIERGEIRSDIDRELVSDLLGGPFVMRILLTGSSVAPRFVREAVDTVLGGIGTHLSKG
jgi:AcrR family transcriptional regulator